MHPRHQRRDSVQTQTTNARRFPVEVASVLARIRRLLSEERQRAFEVGDLVNRLKSDHGMSVKDMAAMIGSSRQRLSELRRTAVAFGPAERDRSVDVHFYTLSARAARRLGMKPAAVLGDVLRQDLQSTRQATAYLAARVRAKESAQARQRAAATAAKLGEVVNRCHHADFRSVLGRLDRGSVKLILADPPYGSYGRTQGVVTTTSAGKRNCDGDSDSFARELTIDLLGLAPSLLAQGGCMIVFRPSGIDPAWLADGIERSGLVGVAAVTWRKSKIKLGRGDDPYGIGTERMLVLARRDEDLINHDASDRSDVIDAAPVRPHYGSAFHLFEKPVELMRRLICKHTHPGELIAEPFGGTGPACVAAIRMGRRWVYTETNPQNFRLGQSRILGAMESAARTTG